MIAILLTVIGHIGEVYNPTIVERCDVITVEHVYGESGRYRFTQVLVEDWSHKPGDIASYKVIKSPRIMRTRRGWMWSHGGRHVYAPVYQVRWSQVDTEVRQRNRLPIAERRGLAKR